MIGKRRAPRAALAGLLVATMVLMAAAAGRSVSCRRLSTVAPGTSKVDLLVATTRAADDNPAVLFSGERGTGLAVNAVDVSIPPEANRRVGQVQWPSRLL